MLTQYIIDNAVKNTSNSRGNWILHLDEKQALREGGKLEIVKNKQSLENGGKLATGFDWDKQSQLRIHFHRFAARNMPMDDDGLAIAFKPVRDGLIGSLSDSFNQKFDDGNQELFHFIYSQCKTPDPVFADTILITIDLMPEQSPYSSVIMRWGYQPKLIDKASLVATLGEMRSAKLAGLSQELKTSRTGTKKVAKLQKELKKTKKAIAHCF